MSECSVENYLEILNKQLNDMGIKNGKNILDNVKEQMISLLQVWNDLETRNGILLLAMEEAQYYLPKCNIYIKAFVVMAIRNSLIESAGSDFYKEYGFEKQLSDEDIKKITCRAIVYFEKFPFEKYSNMLKDKEIDNYYLKIIKKYPIAWEVALKTANAKALDVRFSKILKDDGCFVSLVPNILLNNKDNKLGISEVVEDGISENFNNVLCEVLESSVSNGIGFFTDSFKFLSRNFEKVLKTMEYLLERDSAFITFNYFLTNGYVSRRKVLLRPAHNVDEMENKFKMTKDISKKHKNALELRKKLM